MCVALIEKKRKRFDSDPPLPSAAQTSQKSRFFTFQTLTLGELQPVAFGQDLNERSHVGVSMLLAGLKQDLSGKILQFKIFF